jgi:hypothetical protein
VEVAEGHVKAQRAVVRIVVELVELLVHHRLDMHSLLVECLNRHHLQIKVTRTMGVCKLFILRLLSQIVMAAQCLP